MFLNGSLAQTNSSKSGLTSRFVLWYHCGMWADCVPGHFLRTVQELGSVFRSLFRKDPRGLTTSWTSLTDYISATFCHTDAGQNSTYSLPYPVSLSGQPLIRNWSFTSNKLCLALAPPLCCKATSMVVRNLAEELNALLSAGIDPGIIVKRVASAGSAASAENTPPYLTWS